MPTKKVKKYSKKPYNKVKKYTPWYEAKYTPKQLAKYAIDGLWKLKGLVNSEMYKFDVTESGTPVVSAGTYAVLLSPIAIGDGPSDRTGNSIFVRALNIHGQLIFNSSGSSPQFVRVAIVIDTQQVADTSASYTTLYNSSTYNSHVNVATAGRYKILYSRVFELDNVNNLSRMMNINIPMRHHVRFNGTASTDIQKGGLYILASSSEATNGPTIKYESRLSFHDN